MFKRSFLVRQRKGIQNEEKRHQVRLRAASRFSLYSMSLRRRLLLITSSMEGYVGISALFRLDIREPPSFFFGMVVGFAILFPCMQFPIRSIWKNYQLLLLLWKVHVKTALQSPEPKFCRSFPCSKPCQGLLECCFGDNGCGGGYGWRVFVDNQLPLLFQNQMIINNPGYVSSLKERLPNRDYLKKKKSQEAFYIKAKLNSQLAEQLKYLSKKPHPRTTSIVEITTKEDPRRACSSLQMACGDLQGLEGVQPARASTSKQKRNIGHCWSQRNVTLMNDASKMQKYRKFSSNAELGEDQSRPESQRRKLSLVQAPPRKEKLCLMTWLVLIRKLFVEEFRKRSSKTVKLGVLFSYIQKLDNEGLDEFSSLIEPMEYEIELSKSQIVAVLETHFTVPKKGSKPGKTDQQGKASFFEIMGCLMQFQSKNGGQIKQNPKSTSSEQEAVETARFQEGGEEVKKRKMSEKKRQLNSLVPKMQTHKYIKENGKENGKENAVASTNLNAESLFRSPSACNKSRQSLNPSQSPFTITDSRSIENSSQLMEREESGPLVLKKGGFEENEERHEGLLGMLTIEGKSPRELMVSEIYQSIQKEGFVHNNNVSFSLEHLEIDSHLSFEHTVHSFEEILRKIQNIQGSYRAKLEDSKCDHNEEDVNLLLQQLINYRIASSNEPFEEEGYSYLVSFENLCEFKEHNRGIMQALLQSTYLREYFNALEGVKIHHSAPFLKSVAPLLHPAIRIMNITANNLTQLDFLKDLSSQNTLEFLNISHNMFADVTPILKRCGKLKELHCQANAISAIRECKVTSQELKIIDLSSNKLEKEKDLAGLVGVSSLIIINILNNPLTHGTWKHNWTGIIPLNNIYTMDNLYVMSAYGHQKDITFSIDKSPMRARERTSEFAPSENTRTNNEPRGKQTPKTDVLPAKLEIQSTAKVINKPPEPPKQKISKIKAFIDGKII